MWRKIKKNQLKKEGRWCRGGTWAWVMVEGAGVVVIYISGVGGGRWVCLVRGNSRLTSALGATKTVWRAAGGAGGASSVAWAYWPSASPDTRDLCYLRPRHAPHHLILPHFYLVFSSSSSWSSSSSLSLSLSHSFLYLSQLTFFHIHKQINKYILMLFPVLSFLLLQQ